MPGKANKDLKKAEADSNGRGVRMRTLKMKIYHFARLGAENVGRYGEERVENHLRAAGRECIYNGLSCHLNGKPLLSKDLIELY